MEEDDFGSSAYGSTMGLSVELSPVEVLLRQLRFTQHHGVDSARELALHTSLGHLLRDSGNLADAAKHYQRATNLARDPADLVPVQRALGLVELQQGHLVLARGLLEDALRQLAAWPGPTMQEELADSIRWALGDVSKELGQFDEALKFYTLTWDAFATRRDTADVDQLPLLAAEISEVHARRGELEKAFGWLRRATVQLHVNRLSVQGLDSTDEAKIQSYLGAIYHAAGDVTRAMEMYLKAVRTQERALRPIHPDLLATRMGIARAQRDLGDSSRALKVIEVVEASIRAGPKEGLDLSRALVLKADLLREAQRYEEAEKTIQEALRHQEACFGSEDHPEYAVALGSYGSVLHDQGKHAEAHRQYNQALNMNLRTVGHNHPESAALYNSLGTLFEDTGDDSNAQIHFAKCLDIQLNTVGDRSPDVSNTYNNLATILFRRGEIDDAADLLRKALRVLDLAGVPKGNPDRSLYEENLREVLASLSEQRAVAAAAAAATMPSKTATAAGLVLGLAEEAVETAM
jgi:tetratricopeptide (TPR) repeat protein